MVENKNPKSKILAFIASMGEACAHYRILQPAKHLTSFKDINYYVTNSFKMVYPDENMPLVQMGLHSDYKDYDTFIFQRETRIPVFAFMMIAQKAKNIRCIYEVDDNFIDFPQGHAFYEESKEILPRIKYFYYHANNITCTTEPLKDMLSKFNKNVHVIPNSIDFEFFDYFAKKNYDPDNIIIGWTGSRYHHHDILIIEEVVTDIVNKYKNVKFFHCNTKQAYRNKEIEFFKNIPPCKKIIHPRVTIDRYPEMVSNIDIGIAPLENNPFNESKSNLKYLEYSALGIPSICSKVYPYEKTKNFQGILTNNDYKSWKYALELLINDCSARKEIGTKARENVRKNYNQIDISIQWHDLFIKK